MTHLLKLFVKRLILDICDEADTVFESFKHLWVLYFELSCLLRLYVKMGPRERWLRKFSGLLDVASKPLSAIFLDGQVFCGVYAWVSVMTGKMYVGSTIDFRRRVYAHVRCLRKEPKQHVHRFLRGFGKHLFVPIPLVSCPRGQLRHVEEAVIGCLQPGLNREWMPTAGDSRRTRGLLLRSHTAREVIRRREGPTVTAGVCSATFLRGGLCLPSVSAALLYAYDMRLSSLSLLVRAGSLHLNLRHGLHRLFDKSVVSVQDCDALDRVPLSDCWKVLLKPLAKPVVLHVHKLSAVGWRLWAVDTLTTLIRQPQTRRDIYRLN